MVNFIQYIDPSIKIGSIQDNKEQTSTISPTDSKSKRIARRVLAQFVTILMNFGTALGINFFSQSLRDSYKNIFTYKDIKDITEKVSSEPTKQNSLSDKALTRVSSRKKSSLSSTSSSTIDDNKDSETQLQKAVLSTPAMSFMRNPLSPGKRAGDQIQIGDMVYQLVIPKEYYSEPEKQNETTVVQISSSQTLPKINLRKLLEKNRIFLNLWLDLIPRTTIYEVGQDGKVNQDTPIAETQEEENARIDSIVKLLSQSIIAPEIFNKLCQRNQNPLNFLDRIGYQNVPGFSNRIDFNQGHDPESRIIW